MGGTTGSEWKLKAVLVIIVLEVLLHMIQMGLYGTPADPLQGAPSFISVILGFSSWLTFTDMGMPWWALFPIAMLNLILIGIVVWIVYTEIKDYIPLT